MKKLAASLLLALTVTSATASAAFAKNGNDDGITGRIDCRHHEVVCVVQ